MNYHANCELLEWFLVYPLKLEYIPGAKRSYDQKHYDQSYKEAIVAEMLGGKSAAQIAQPGQIAVQTLYKWKEKIASGAFA